MSSAGTILDAIKRQRNNREMQRWLRSKYSDKISGYLKPSDKKFNPEFQKKLSKEQIALIKQEVRAEVRREIILAWVYTFIVALAILGALYFVLS